MTQQHTPGPWAVYPENLGGCCVRTEQGGYIIADFSWPHEEDNPANARLIAAAPDLLEALMRLLQVAPEERQTPSVWLPRVDAARAAVAKALGTEPTA